MNDRRPYSLLQIRELGHGIHDLPRFDTSDFRLFTVRLDPHETRLPIARSTETLLLVVEGSLTVVWCEATRVATELGERDAASTNSPGRRGAAGGRGERHRPRDGEPKVVSCVMQPLRGRLR
jgi:hypothetical protein